MNSLIVYDERDDKKVILKLAKKNSDITDKIIHGHDEAREIKNLKVPTTKTVFQRTVNRRC